jgi:hypothetical protein
MGQFRGVIELDNRFAIGNIVVAQCTKGRGLLGTDVLKVDYSQMSINHATSQVRTMSKKLGCLAYFKAKILLKKNVQPSFYSSRPIPIHFKPLVFTKLKSMIEQEILERVPPGGSLWASPPVVVRKPDGDLRICKRQDM